MHSFIAFLAGQASDHRGRTIDDYKAFRDTDWEAQHDIIQWAFPTKTVSQYNANAPVVPEDYTFEFDLTVMNNILVLMENYLKSLGIYSKDAEYPSGNILAFEYIPAPLRFSVPWIRPGNHNYKRLTRLIECLGIFGLEAFQKDLAEYLIFDFAVQNSKGVDASAVAYWVAAWENKRHLLR